MDDVQLFGTHKNFDNFIEVGEGLLQGCTPHVVGSLHRAPIASDICVLLDHDTVSINIRTICIQHFGKH